MEQRQRVNIRYHSVCCETLRQIVLISVFLYLVFRRPKRNKIKPPIVATANTPREENPM